VEFIEAQGDYMRFHADGRSYLYYATIKRLEADLNPDFFMRVHRSFIVARRCVRTLRSRGQGNWALTLDSGQAVPVSTTYLDAVRKLANR
jgi:two-component system LytT family response regulator